MDCAKFEFLNACERLLGDRYAAFAQQGMTPHQLCKEIAQDVFIYTIDPTDPDNKDDLNIVREVATRLWAGDGTTGFSTEN